MKVWDVVIVGAGPAGCSTAALLAREGVDVIVLEEHMEVGRPLHCAGLVSPRTLAHLEKAEVLERIRGLRIHPPEGKALEIATMEPKAVVIDRAGCDRMLASRAVRAGARLMLGARARDARIGRDGVKIALRDGRMLGAKLVIGADGVRSIVRRSMGIPQVQDVLPAATAEIMRPEDWPDGMVEIYLGGKVAPGFFAWAVPAGEVLRLGLASGTSASPVTLLRRLISVQHGRVIAMHGGAIPIGMLEHLHGERALLVGDAAAQVKPLSGGGLLLGQLCAVHCARHALDALRFGDFSERSLEGYTRACEMEYGREMRRALVMRRVFTSLTDEDIRRVVGLLRSPGVVELIAVEGDIDFPSKLAKPVLAKAPKLIRFSPRLLKTFL